LARTLTSILFDREAWSSSVVVSTRTRYPLATLQQAVIPQAGRVAWGRKSALFLFTST